MIAMEFVLIAMGQATGNAKLVYLKLLLPTDIVHALNTNTMICSKSNAPTAMEFVLSVKEIQLTAHHVGRRVEYPA
jgi:hypothetical protein